MNWTGTQAKESSSDKEPIYTRREAITAGAALFGTLTFVEANTMAMRIETTRHTVPMPNLDAPIRVIQLSDFHRSQFVSEQFIGRAVREANALEPDVLLLTGDFVTRTSEYAESCMRQLSGLKAKVGIYAVLGNHDYWCDEGTGGSVIADWLEQISIEVITNRSIRLKNGLRLVGIDDLLAGVINYRRGLEDVRANEPVLVMSHNPGTFYTLCRYNFLTIAGHTHGGQIYVPGISTRLVGSHFLRGWYHQNGYPGRMYISRGLGTIHVPMRVCSAPEIAVFDLVPTRV